MSPWDEKNVPGFVAAMRKLPVDDLEHLTAMFDCVPRYEERADKDYHIDNLLWKLLELRRKAEDADEMHAALHVLKKHQ